MTDQQKIPEFAKDGLIQLHWQKRDDTTQTVFVAQGGDFATDQEMQDWLTRMIKEKQSECPEGWGPMVCDSTYPRFVKAVG